MAEGKIFICQGRVAVPGKIEGKVRVIKEIKQIAELQEDEILVVKMGDQYSVSDIQKAKAVITDHGTIMCHAAIVCREMQKACIVGTKIATRRLHTGDTVIVDYDANVFKKD